MNYLSLKINGQEATAPQGIPTGGLKENELLIQNVLGLLIFGAVLLALVFLILGGISWITSGGDKAKIQAARNRLLYAIIGLVIVFLSFLIVNLVGFMFGVNLLSTTLPTP